MSQKVDTPVPQGTYLPAVRHADLVFTSGMTPRKAGVLMYSGKIQKSDSIEIHRDAVRLATTNAMIAAQSCLNEGEGIATILQLSVFLNTGPEFTEHPRIADFASELIVDQLGEECIGSRVAIGVTSLPSNAPVEVTLIAKVVESRAIR
jgi:enamine deaminase RidA (YjgF/YER057c/UK114 family)